MPDTVDGKMMNFEPPTEEEKQAAIQSLKWNIAIGTTFALLVRAGKRHKFYGTFLTFPLLSTLCPRATFVSWAPFFCTVQKKKKKKTSKKSLNFFFTSSAGHMRKLVSVYSQKTVQQCKCKDVLFACTCAVNLHSRLHTSIFALFSGFPAYFSCFIYNYRNFRMCSAP